SRRESIPNRTSFGAGRERGRRGALPSMVRHNRRRSRMFGLVNWLRKTTLAQSQKPRAKGKRRLALESLEDRVVPSTINWVNRGMVSDNFDTAFGSNAALARQVVDTAINEWQFAIQNFNQVGHGDNNHIDVNVSIDLTAGSSGGVTNVNTVDANGKPTSATISLGRTGDGANAWYLDPNEFSTAF